ncbi:MAG: DUF3558 domain-containing protein [Pseudonocardiales bacterium]
MPRIIVLVCALAAASTLIGGCSRTDGSSAPPSSGAGVTSQQPRQLSPPVQNPRDIRVYGERPCDVFTTEQLAGFGFDLPPNSTRALPSGHRVCVWIDSGHNGRLFVATYPDWDVLERTYLAGAGLPVFEPIEIAGLPAVVYQDAIGLPGCDVTVGLAERQGLDVGFTDLREPPDDPCGAARAAAEVAVGNLPPLN